MLRRQWLRPIAAACLLGLTACPQKTAIWLLSGTEPGQPVFGVGEKQDGASLTDLPYVLISPCAEFDGTAGPAVWMLQRVAVNAAVPRQGQVGHTPPGYRVAKGEDRLQRGCCVASIHGTGRVDFEVLGDRSSVERSQR